MTLKPLFFLLGAIFIVSLAFSFVSDIHPYGDAQAYDRIGWNLARGFGYLEHEENAANPEKDDAIFRVGPAYEFFLAGVYTLFGHYREPVWIIQALLRALTAFFLFKIALLLFSHHPKKEWIGFAAAAIFGFFPDLILINSFLLHETLLLFLSVAAVYFSLIALVTRPETNFSNPRRGRAKFAPQILGIRDLQKFVSRRGSMVITASLFWALAILTRPSELLPFLIFPAALFLATQKTRLVALSFLFPFLLVGGWSLRNSLLYNQPLFTTTAGAYALWVGNNAKASGGYDRPVALQEARERYHSTGLSRVSLKNMYAFIIHRPLKFLELQFKKTIIYFSLIRPTGFWPHLQYVPLQRLFVIGASFTATALLFIAGAAGVWMLGKQKNNILLAFLGFLLAKPIAVIPFYVETRYRYSFYPLLAIMAAFFVIHIFSSRKPALRIAAGTVAAFLTIASIDAWFSLPVILNRLPYLLYNIW